MKTVQPPSGASPLSHTPLIGRLSWNARAKICAVGTGWPASVTDSVAVEPPLNSSGVTCRPLCVKQLPGTAQSRDAAVRGSAPASCWSGRMVRKYRLAVSGTGMLAGFASEWPDATTVMWLLCMLSASVAVVVSASGWPGSTYHVESSSSSQR